MKDQRTIRALLVAREKLRDLAAAEHAAVAHARDVAASRVASAREDLDRAIGEAAHTLGNAQSIYDLDTIANDIARRHIAISAARSSHVEAQSRADRSAAALRESTRKLRTAERIAELASDEVSGIESRAEQRANDDLASRRR